mmetsp:Transcript_36480/g.94775  ORF Transcript_36480/g.94775 Transcript_36480/m.94775 type:complete len:118 (+) Transcript_36480:219-572(+)
MSSKYQREVEHRLSVLQAQSTRWKELFPGRTDDDEEELAWLKEQLQEQISSVEDALKKLKGVSACACFVGLKFSQSGPRTHRSLLDTVKKRLISNLRRLEIYPLLQLKRSFRKLKKS